MLVTGSRALPRLVLASLAGGILLGAAARVLMRLIALESGLPGSFSAGGSLEVVLFGALVGTPIAFGFGWIRPHLRLRVPFAGLALGLLVIGGLTLVQPESARSALAGTPDTPLLTWLGFALLFVGWGVGLDLAVHRLRSAPKRSESNGSFSGQ